MSLPFPNIYHLRTVAEASSKACYVCLKPSVKVLITPDIDAEAEAAKKKEEVLDKEIEKVKQEYEEKQRKKGKKKSKDDDKDKKKDDQDDDEAEKERDDKIKALQSGANAGEKAADIQRVYALHKNFYQMRIDRIRNMEAAKRSQQRIKDPSFFPATPKGDIA